MARRRSCKIATVKGALTSRDPVEVLAAAKMCRGKDITPALKQAWRDSPDWRERLAYIYAYGVARITTEYAMGVFEAAPTGIRMALLNDMNPKRVPIEVYLNELRHTDTEYALAVAKKFKDFSLPQETIRQLVTKSTYAAEMAAGYYAAAGQMVPSSWIYAGLRSFLSDVNEAALYAATGRKFGIKTLRRWWDEVDPEFSSLVVQLETTERRAKRGLITEGLKSGNNNLMMAAARAAETAEFSADEILEMAGQSQPQMRAAAVYAAANKGTFNDRWFYRYINDPDEAVKTAVYHALTSRSLKGLREFAPPEYVYKQCLSGVKVVASIPEDAEVRGKLTGWGRTNKAYIVAVLGSFYGENVGVSTFDPGVRYHVGDDVSIWDFNRERGLDGPGFYFSSFDPKRYG